MLTTLRNLLVAASLAGFIGLLIAFNAAKPRILVLHSGDESSRWVGDVDAGLRAELAVNRRPVAATWHYLRLTLHTRPEARVAALAAARRAIATQDPDIVIAVDDESNRSIASQYVGRPRPRIVYASIDQPPTTYGYDTAANVSGIVEELPLAAVRDAASAIRPRGALRIAAIAVASDTGRAERMQVEQFDWSPHTLVAAATAGTYADWRRFVEDSADTADVLLVLSFLGLARAADDVQPVEATEIAGWVEDHARPLPIGLHVDSVVAGGALSISPPPADYGRRAMRLALDWLTAPATAAPPAPLTSAHFDVAARPARLAARGVALPAIYIEAARAGLGLIAD